MNNFFKKFGLSRVEIVIVSIIILTFLISTFIIAIISSQHTSQNIKLRRDVNEQLAKDWCNKLKVNCIAIKCDGGNNYSECDININDNVHALECFNGKSCYLQR